MATHTQLPIYKAAYSLLDIVTDLVKNMPRDFKRLIGEEIARESSAITILVFRANVAQEKEPYLLKLPIAQRENWTPADQPLPPPANAEVTGRPPHGPE